MKLTVFQSDKGDCLLVNTASGHHMLVDGGMASSYTAHVSPTLGKMQKAKQVLDVVYVSHIDADHISGVLQMLDDLVKWRVYDHQKKTKNPKAKPPACERPPDIKALWHNGFRNQIGQKAVEIDDVLSASAQTLMAAESPLLKELAGIRGDLATSIRQALQLSSRISTGQLNIKLNPEYQGRLMQVTVGQSPLTLGSAKLFVIGPCPEDLRKLRDEWETWLSENKEAVARLRRKAQTDEDKLHSNAQTILAEALTKEGESLGARLVASSRFPVTELDAARKVLGQRKMVTTPNLASLMFLLEENGKTVILTGDGHCENILKGLKRQGMLTRDKPLRVNVLKVQHHGSEHNIDQPFLEQVLADNYIFCGNGFSNNPDLDVVKLLVETRKKAQGPFRLWFNCTADTVKNAGWAKHMKAVENLTKQLMKKTSNKGKATFLKDSSFELVL
jgi:beta-lactamase superfamily II metal-dependent hydrolase